MHKGLFSSTIYVIDVETTGISPANDRITEIGIVKIKNGRIKGDFEALVDPEQFIPPYITDMTGITNDMVFNKPNFKDTYPYISEFISEKDAIIAGHNVRFDYNFINCSLMRNNMERLVNDTICTARLARRLSLGIRRKSLQNLCTYFNIRQVRRHRALDDAMVTAKILIKLLKILNEQFNINERDELISFQYKKISTVKPESPRIKELRTKVRALPDKPGVYFFKDKEGKIIYVGKAKSLKSRVSSYFVTNEKHPEKLRKMLRRIHEIDFTLTGSELSALIEESKFIKKLKPQFNTANKRIRYYPFIKIDIQNSYPIAEKTLEIKMDGAKYYGPFRSNFTVNTILERIKKEFSLRKCDDKRFIPDKKISACMYHQIGVCGAPCNFTQSFTKYRNEVSKVEQFIEAQTSDSAISLLENKMTEYSDNMEYENAAFIRDKITDLKKVLMNMQLSTTKGYQQNFIVKCRNGSPGRYEFFFIRNGKLLNSRILDNNEIKEDIKKEVDGMYYKSNLFSSVHYNKKEKLSNEEIDAMRLIMNWAYLNNSDESLMVIDEKTSPEEIFGFIKKHR